MGARDRQARAFVLTLDKDLHKCARYEKHNLKEQGFVNVSIDTFTEMVEKDGMIKVLKKAGVCFNA